MIIAIASVLAITMGGYWYAGDGSSGGGVGGTITPPFASSLLDSFRFVVPLVFVLCPTAQQQVVAAAAPGMFVRCIRADIFHTTYDRLSE